MKLAFSGVLFLAVAAAQVKSVTVDIKDAQGQSVGKGVLTQAQPQGVKLDLDITKLPPGEHVFHIHQKPICDPESEFNSAALQYDPTGEMYGNAQHAAHSGHSAGDPGTSVNVAADGTGHKTVIFPKLTMGEDDRSIFANGGTAMVFHAAAGAAGPTRIACGVIVRPK